MSSSATWACARASWVVGLLAMTSGCALLTKSSPIVPRYFTPELAEVAPAPLLGDAPRFEVRLGRVAGGSYLKERMAYRDSGHEFGFREAERWTERPEAYLERALERSLFEERGLRRSLSGTAATLTAELIEFEELTSAAPSVRLRVRYALHDERTVFFERSFTVERPLAPGPEASRPARVAAGLGDALREAAAKIAGEVIADRSADRSMATVSR
jgi:cholesterol transport system auxiliary component